MNQKIRLFPDPVLRKPAAIVLRFNRALGDLVSSLDSVMRAQSMGIGIAAPQLGIRKAIAIVDVRSRVPGAQRIVMINPVILELREPKISREGCMSLPEYTANVLRYDWVRYRCQGIDGQISERISLGIEAVCVQHEADHLQGYLFFDRVTSLKTDMLPRLSNRKK